MIYQYNTRLANKETYYLPKIRTTYGKFNIRFLGVKIWNDIQDDYKTKSRSCSKTLIITSLLNHYKILLIFSIFAIYANLRYSLL